MATLNTFMLLTAMSTPATINVERIVAFPWQQWLRDRTTVERCMYSACLITSYG